MFYFQDTRQYSMIFIRLIPKTGKKDLHSQTKECLSLPLRLTAPVRVVSWMLSWDRPIFYGNFQRKVAIDGELGRWALDSNERDWYPKLSDRSSILITSKSHTSSIFPWMKRSIFQMKEDEGNLCFAWWVSSAKLSVGHSGSSISLYMKRYMAVEGARRI